MHIKDSWNPCKVENIVYNDKPHAGDKYAADAWIEIFVQQARHNPKYRGMD